MQVRFTCPACKGSHVLDMPETTIHMTCSRTGKHLSLKLREGADIVDGIWFGRADPLPARAERVADYRISVTLDPDRHELQGRERVVWHNTSTDEVSDLWFHLYLNAFKNSRSSFFRESGGQLRGVTAEAESWGAIDVTSIRLSNGHDLLPDAHFVQPDDDTTGVARFLANKGEGFHHVCFEVPDLNAALMRLEMDGIELIDSAARKGAEGPVAFLHPRSCQGVLVELIEAPGGPAWGALGY